ncbi:MAG: type II toxin-antitoxin system RelE/ParE family toxin [Pseudomonadota bacterium]
MPPVDVLLFKENDGTVPVADWLKGLESKAQDKCYVGMERLGELGYELRRPQADYLRDGIYELRIRYRRLNHRLLYFFFGDTAVVVSHGLTKEDRIPDVDIDRAVDRKRKFKHDPESHTFVWEGR